MAVRVLGKQSERRFSQSANMAVPELVSANKSELMRQPRLFLAIILSMDIDNHRLILEQFDQIVITMFQFEFQLFRI